MKKFIKGLTVTAALLCMLTVTACSNKAPQPEGTTAPVVTAEPETRPEPTVGISLPTEDPNEVAPDYTVPAAEDATEATQAEELPESTHDPDENELPEMGL